MGRTKLTIRERKIRRRTTKRNQDLKKTSVIGYQRPESFPKIDHTTGKPIE